MTYNVAPLDTQAGDSQGNTGRETVSEAVIISPFIFTDDKNRSTIIGGELCRDSDKLCFIYSIFYRESLQPDELWDTLWLVTFDRLGQKTCIVK